MLVKAARSEHICIYANTQLNCVFTCMCFFFGGEVEGRDNGKQKQFQRYKLYYSRSISLLKDTLSLH